MFIALIMHKLPAALGLTTFLMHEKQSQKTIALHLLAFTLSSPVTALITYFSFKAASNESSPAVLIAVGMFLLVSAGTFLYVATIHILPEVYCNTDIHRPHSHKHRAADHVHQEETHYRKEIELIFMILGLMVPFVPELLF